MYSGGQFYAAIETDNGVSFYDRKGLAWLIAGNRNLGSSR